MDRWRTHLKCVSSYNMYNLLVGFDSPTFMKFHPSPCALSRALPSSLRLRLSSSSSIRLLVASRRDEKQHTTSRRRDRSLSCDCGSKLHCGLLFVDGDTKRQKRRKNTQTNTNYRMMRRATASIILSEFFEGCFVNFRLTKLRKQLHNNSRVSLL